MNEFEAQKTTGIELSCPDGVRWENLPRCAAELIGAGVREWVVIHFPQGAFALGAGGESVKQGSVLLPQDRIVGTAGAGDAFAAGLLLGLHEGRRMSLCLRDAVSAAGLCITESTTSGALRSLDECRRFAEAFGYRNPG